jgi:cell wall-associated NlpC family hydrolase
MHSDFLYAADRLPTLLPRVHRGRNPDEGMDCLGLVLWLYKDSGHPIPFLEMPYAERDQNSPRMWDRAIKVASSMMSDASDETKAGLDRDGDIWVFKDESGGVGVGVYIDGEVLAMYDTLRRRNADSIRVYVKRSFRL